MLGSPPKCKNAHSGVKRKKRVRKQKNYRNYIYYVLGTFMYITALVVLLQTLLTL